MKIKETLSSSIPATTRLLLPHLEDHSGRTHLIAFLTACHQPFGISIKTPTHENSHA
jgi:hypothetical protein